MVRACLATGLSRSGYYRPEKDWRIADAAVINAINDVLKKSPQAGFWTCFGRLRFQKASLKPRAFSVFLSNLASKNCLNKR